MTEQERFEIVLGELGRLVLAFGDLREHFVIVGGQVVALEDRARGGSGLLRVALPSGPAVERGFSFDLDLLYDGEAGSQDDRIPEVLRTLGYSRSGARWLKEVAGVSVAVDLLAAPNTSADTLPTEMTTAAGGAIAAARVHRHLELRIGDKAFDIPVPDALGFLALKLEAKRVRPEMKKDSFDIFAYVHLLGAAEVARQLRTSPDGVPIREGLRALFGSATSEGVLDVLAFSPTLEESDRELVVRFVLDLFDEVCAG